MNVTKLSLYLDDFLNVLRRTGAQCVCVLVEWINKVVSEEVFPYNKTINPIMTEISWRSSDPYSFSPVGIARPHFPDLLWLGHVPIKGKPYKSWIKVTYVCAK